MANQTSNPRDDNPASLLTREEIEALLGGGRGEAGDAASGLRAHIDAAPGPFARLPMLEPVLHRFAEMLPRALTAFAAVPAQVSIETSDTVKLGSYLDNVALPSMLAVWHADPWNGRALMTLDGALVCAALDVLMGGRRGGSAARIEGRPYSPLERGLMERLARQVLETLALAFRPVSRVAFNFEHLESDPRFAAIVPSESSCALTRLAVSLDGRAGRMEIVLPYATLDAAGDKLRGDAAAGHDPRWQTHMAGQLRASEVRADAVLDRLTMKLRDVLGWKIGTRVMLNATPRSNVELRSGDVPLLSGKLGKRGNRLAVQIERWLARRPEGAP